MPKKTKAQQGKSTITAKGKVKGRPAGRGRPVLPKKSAALKKYKIPLPDGRPVKYDPIMNERAFRMAFLGSSNEQIAESLAISPDTLYQWMHKYPMFSESINKGKLDPVGAVKAALYHRAIGYSHPSEEISVSFGTVTRVKTTKQYAPDTAAAFIFLKNVDPENWRDKREIGFTNKDNEDINIFELPKNDRNDLGIETKSESEPKG